MNFVCIAPFGDYVPGDVVAFDEGASPSAAFFAPRPVADVPAPPPSTDPITPPVS
jgi:hypothetical protein